MYLNKLYYINQFNCSDFQERTIFSRKNRKFSARKNLNDIQIKILELNRNRTFNLDGRKSRRESDGWELNSESNNSNLFEEPEENPWKIKSTVKEELFGQIKTGDDIFEEVINFLKFFLGFIIFLPFFNTFKTFKTQ